MMRIYIAGPMTGYENFNRKKFLKMAEDIKLMGHEPVHTADMPEGLEYEDYMTESLKRLGACEGVMLLNGWEGSKGANIELKKAKELGLKIFKESEGLLCLLRS